MDITNRNAILLLSCLPLLACGEQFDWLVIETEVQEVCIVDMVTDFQAAPEGFIRHVLGSDELGALIFSDELSASMYLRGFGISAQAGIENIDFIDRLRVEVSVPGQNAVELLRYQGGGETGEGLFVKSESAVDLASFLEMADMEMLVEFEGPLPQTAWTATMEVCVSAKAAYSQSF